MGGPKEKLDLSDLWATKAKPTAIHSPKTTCNPKTTRAFSYLKHVVELFFALLIPPLAVLGTPLWLFRKKSRARQRAKRAFLQCMSYPRIFSLWYEELRRL